MAVTKKVFARYVFRRSMSECHPMLMTIRRYVELERRYIAEKTPGWRWCLSSKCSHGQVHVKGSVPGSQSNPIDLSERRGSSLTSRIMNRIRTVSSTQKPRNATESESVSLPAFEPDIFICADCGHQACVPCDRPWHEHETCEEYQARIKDKIKEEDASLAAIHKITKKCPQCSKSIEKNGGCPHMTCTQCYSDFCWNCEQPINRNGQYCACGRIPGH